MKSFLLLIAISQLLTSAHANAEQHKPYVNLCCPVGYIFTKQIIIKDVLHRCDKNKTIEVNECVLGDSIKFEEALKEAKDEYSINQVQFKYQPLGCDMSSAYFYFSDYTVVNFSRKINEDYKTFVFFSSEENVTQTKEFSVDSSCLAITTDELGYWHDTLICNDEQQKVYQTMYEVLLFISCFFLLVTLMFYMCSQLKKPLIGKLMIGFLINVFFHYCFNGLSRVLKIHYGDITSQSICYFLGYFKIYTFTSFFLWMNAMTIDITKKLTRFRPRQEETYEQSLRKLLKVSIYAQGLPLLQTILIGVIDQTSDCDETTFPLPNMARFQCNIRGTWPYPHTFINFLKTPEFLYFYLLILIVVVVNTICFCYTGVILTKHLLLIRNNLPSVDNILGEAEMKHIKLVLKLIIIMGIPWILELVSFYYQYTEKQADETIILLLDIVNLLTGLLIFIVLIFKKSMLKGLFFAEKRLQEENNSKAIEMKMKL